MESANENRESEDDMLDPGADTRAAQETAPAPVLPANETERRAGAGEIPAEKVGDGWGAKRGDAPPINSATVLNELREERIEQLVRVPTSGREFLERVKAHHRADKERRERERMESDNPDANLTADMINDMRDERDEQILSAVLGIYEEEE